MNMTEDKTPPSREPDGAASATGNAEMKFSCQMQSQQTTNVIDLSKGLSFPPPEHIRVIEEYMKEKGFVFSEIEEWKKEIECRRELKCEQMEAQNECNKQQMKLEKCKTYCFIFSMYMVAAAFGAFAVIAILLLFKNCDMFFVNRVAEGGICAGLCALLAFAIVINNIRGGNRRP
jgi:hypothetical protein